MAIAFDAASSGKGGTPFSHTTASGAYMLVASESGISAITYNGVSLTLYTTYTPSFPPGTNCLPIKIWILQNPTSGSNNISGTGTGAIVVGTYTGLNEIPIEAESDADSANNQVSTWTGTVSTVTDNSWVITFALWPGGVSRKVGAGSSTSLRAQYFGDLNAGGIGLLDSNAAVTPAGSRTININVLNTADNPSSDFMTTVTLAIRLPTSISVSDSISISESVNMEKIVDVSVSDSISITESVNLEYVTTISVSDSLTISESVTMDNGTLPGISVSDSISILDIPHVDYYPSLLAGYQEMDSGEDSLPLGMDDETML